MKGKGLAYSKRAGIFLTVISLCIMTLTASCSRGDVAALTDIRGGETRSTLSPANFTGETARAYKIAKEIPEVLDGLYCYCDCKKHSGHKSLLSCYVDGHAEQCDVCQDEAFMAYELHKQGKDVLAIRSAVDARYARK